MMETQNAVMESNKHASLLAQHQHHVKHYAAHGLRVLWNISNEVVESIAQVDPHLSREMNNAAVTAHLLGNTQVHPVHVFACIQSESLGA